MSQFDYIVIGGGSAGCVLANRLSRNPSHRVALIEAGPADKNPMIRVPIGIIGLMRSAKLNWQFYTEPEENLHNQRKFWPRGKTLGGSSAINAMIYTRGHRKDYDQWSELGNKGWSFADVLPYFKKSQNQERGASEYHGTGGPLNVADLRVDHEISKTFVKAATEVGYPANNDFNGPEQEGVGIYQVTQKNGHRCSVAEAYIRPAENRSNLEIITEANVSKILFENKQATGVEYIRHGINYTISAKQEVVLSAGAIGSPQVLMLSGVGPAEELEEHTIEAIHELPGVGKNLQDHLDILLVQKCKKPVTIGISLPFLFNGIKEFFKYLTQRSGLLTTNVAEAGGFVKSDESQEIPDLQFHLTNATLDNHGLGNSALIGHGYSLHICDLRPKSRGEITLRNRNPLSAPKIHANYLSHPDDMVTMKKAVKAGMDIMNASAFDDYRGDWYSPISPPSSDEDLEHFIRQNAETIYHPVGTCKMGSDEMAVVDDQLRVHGIKNLRVVDASIMPTLIGGNTNAPTVMIAEKAADMILGEVSVNLEDEVALTEPTAPEPVNS